MPLSDKLSFRANGLMRRELMDFLRDPLWQFIGVIVAIIATGVSILLYLKSRNIKRLAYEVISNTPIISIKDEVKGDVQVLFKGKPIKDARLVVLRLWNNGNASISSSDYEDPIEFDFGGTAEILDASILGTVPEGLKDKISLQVNVGSISLSNHLLNKSDSINLKVLLTNYTEELKVRGHINGVKQIDKLISSRERDKMIDRTYIIALSACIGTAPLIGERAQRIFRGRPRGRLGTLGSSDGLVRGRPRRFGSTQGAGATL
jgi:hypothetical protein